jgi:hypothetical protein
MRFFSRFAGRIACALVTLPALTGAGVARADDALAPDADRILAASAARVIPPRPWLYLDDPTLPSPLAVVVFSRATLGGADASPARPFGSDAAHAGGLVESGAEVGLLPWLSIAASGYASTVAPIGEGGAGLVAGLRVAPFAGDGPTRLVLSAGVLRDLTGAAGAWGRVAVSRDWCALRLAATVHGERIFATGRDSADVGASAGASYAATRTLRLGVEYVGQDLEEMVDNEAEGGARHFLGPTVALELLEKRLTINVGPAVGVSRSGVSGAGRAGIGYAF